MKLRWYGTASVMIESNGFKLMADPFLGIPIEENRFRRQLRAIPFRAADAVLVTHGHFDHILDLPRLYNDSFIEIYATATPCNTLLDKGMKLSRLHWIEPGETYEIGDFSIRVYGGRHCRFDLGVVCKRIFKAETFRNPKRLIQLLELNREYPENGETVFYEITAEGRRIQLMGSMGLDPAVDYPTGADALILPFQGTGCPAKTVMPIIERLQPKSIYLDHYDDAFPPMSDHVETATFAAQMSAKGLPTTAMIRGKTYETERGYEVWQR